MGGAPVRPADADGRSGKSLEDGDAAEDAALALELGVTVRELNGYAPATVTVDAQGQVLSVTVTEPRFTPREKALLLAARRERDRPRGRHGIPLDEATNPEHRYDWEVEMPIRDFAQQRLDAEMKAYEDTYGEAAEMSSLLWRVRRRES